MRSILFFWLFIALGVMGALGLLRFQFALRFWARMRQLGYIYVAFVVLLAVLSIVLGRRL